MFGFRLRELIVTTVLLGLIAGVGWLGFQNYMQPAAVPLPASAGAAPDQTELVFLRNVDMSEAIAKDEWRSARADHRAIAYAIAACKGLKHLATMSQEAFSLLLLDLRPSGDHAFNLRPDAVSGPEIVGDKDFPPIVLTVEEAKLLSLSDLIGRTRMLASSQVDSNMPYLRWLGILTLAVSSLATLSVTLQSRLRPDTSPPEPEPEPKAKSDRAIDAAAKADADADAAPAGASPPSVPPAPPTPTKQPALPPRRPRPNRLYEVFSYAAIILSVAGTALTGVRQFFDPSRAYAQNQHTLLQLRQLHAQLALNIGCTAPQTLEASTGAASNPVAALARVSYPDDAFKQWIVLATSLRAEIVPAFAVLPNGLGSQPDLADLSKAK